jgi:putative phage-type endonuclease
MSDFTYTADNIDKIDNTDIIMETIEEYIRDHYTLLAEPDFEETLTQDLLHLFCPFPPETKKRGKDNKNEEDSIKELVYGELEEHIEEAIQHYFTYVMPRRSFQSSFTFGNKDIDKIEKQLEYLKSKPQPAQRTEDWYKFRHNLITASELSKVFDSQAVQNSLIYSKCKPWAPMGRCSNPESPLHWGQKYEPISVMLYEDIYKTKIAEFGCIQHDTLNFIGASPDGINIDKISPRFGRLLEIKNVFSRVIDGIPLKEYWIQMQSQMEVCNLDECDFLETKFVEYNGYREYIEDKFVQGSFVEYESDDEDNEHGESVTKKEEESEDVDNEEKESEPIVIDKPQQCPYKYKGCIMMFSLPNDSTPVYEFKPLMLNDDDEETIWEEETVKKYETNGYRWIKNIYWKLQVFSCVLVLRNRFWFNSCIPQMRTIWETIETERLGGYEHRAPKSRSKKIEVVLKKEVEEDN